MNKMYHYSVFAAAPGGGKQFAIVEGVDNPVDMQRIAAESGQPLTGFIVNAGAKQVEARFFSPTKEKGASDSGALVVGEHLRLLGRVSNKLTVQMGKEGLEVFYEDGLWWSAQQDSQKLRPDYWFANLLYSVRDSGDHILIWGMAGNHKIGAEDALPWLRAGNHKINAVVWLSDTAALTAISPDLEALVSVQHDLKLNGLIVFCQGDPIHLRFFSPAKNLPEDNAGSYTVASLCGFLAEKHKGKVQLEFLQGEAMGKPSRLKASFFARGGVAQRIKVGGEVELLKVPSA